ncbi:hypothetical protein EUGRSUZ_L00088 [Eucalyptus grandis]|uniref:Secreted protein n=1 Tax=Eucalyptus grandis TaxID=71139 RepID=A0A058ZX65_EUCGR|nr:hypothetical protein EUGRSUZ_L00088 [Eucalyptus grandis]
MAMSKVLNLFMFFNSVRLALLRDSSSSASHLSKLFSIYSSSKLIRLPSMPGSITLSLVHPVKSRNLNSIS